MTSWPSSAQPATILRPRPPPSSSASSPPAAKSSAPVGRAHDVKYHRTGRKRLHHPVVGELDLTFEALELPGDPGLRLNVYTAEPGTPSEDSLKEVLQLRRATLGGDKRLHVREE